jgi:hypothetical protein
MIRGSLITCCASLACIANAAMAQSPAGPVTPAGPAEVGPYRPFIDPIDAQSYWFALLIPLALGIAIAYKAVRMPDMNGYPRQVLFMTVQIILGMVALALAFYLFVLVYLPWASGAN